MFATEGRRQPSLIGKDSSGRRIPGGPYTLYQIGGGVLVAAGLIATRSFWGADSSLVAMVVVGAGITAGAVFLLGRIDVSTSNPLRQAAGIIPAMIRASSTRAGLSSPHLRRPGRGRHRSTRGATTYSLTRHPPVAVVDEDLVDEGLVDEHLVDEDLAEVETELDRSNDQDAVIDCDDRTGAAVKGMPGTDSTRVPAPPGDESVDPVAAGAREQLRADDGPHPRPADRVNARLSPLQQFLAAAGMNRED